MKLFQQPNIRRRCDASSWSRAAAALIHQNTCTHECFCGIFGVCFIQLLLFLIYFWRFFFLFFLSLFLFSTVFRWVLFSLICAGAFYEILTNMLNAFKQINEDVNITCAFSMRPHLARRKCTHTSWLGLASPKCTRVKSNEKNRERHRWHIFHMLLLLLLLPRPVLHSIYSIYSAFLSFSDSLNLNANDRVGRFGRNGIEIETEWECQRSTSNRCDFVDFYKINIIFGIHPSIVHTKPIWFKCRYGADTKRRYDFHFVR